ncbi:MAG: amidohydrolase family protein [Armatimonadota bacterium]|nr:amidohydrolase family protein [Armatimonadota bacterium]MDR7438739.1 amidohydrolase family protein [Armatimonadota bacterium]MDR7561955.1 amidohydrolase family protein [Armatimonadota bacterium]MDR7566902.1 amidohydrolase family protein [Armatimonadota bacterium]
MARRMLIKNGCVLTLDRQIGNFSQADVLIEDTRIAAVGPNLTAADAEVLDASGMIVMPGFIDTHRHCWEGILRNIGTDVPLEGERSYLAFVLNQLAPAYRPEDVYIANLVSALGCIDAGITTVLDWSHIQTTPEHTDAAIRALQEAGIRAVFAYGRPWFEPPKPEHPAWIRRAAQQYFSSKDQLLTFGLAIFGPEFDSLEGCRADWQLARELDARITTHVGVGTFGRHGKVGEVGRTGLYGPDTTFIHCCTLSDEEIRLIVDSGATVSLACPVEMMMGHGMPPIQRFLDLGLRPSLSVDVETNVPNDMFTQMRSAISLQHMLVFEQRLAGREDAPPPVTTRDVLEWATIEGARANGLDHKVGTLTPGKEADIILLRTDRPNIFPVNDPIGAVVWGMDTSNVDTVMVAGRILKRGGELVGVDLNRVRQLAYQSRDYVVSKSGFRLPEI